MSIINLQHIRPNRIPIIDLLKTKLYDTNTAYFSIHIKINKTAFQGEGFLCL